MEIRICWGLRSVVLKGEHVQCVSQLLVGRGKGSLKLCSLPRDLLACTVRLFVEMADRGVDQNKELNFSVCEEDFESGGQMAAQGTGEAHSPASERDKDEEMEDPKSPPRDERYPSQIGDMERPGPSLWVPASALPKCPETPRPPRKSKPPVADNLSSPKVSKPWRWGGRSLRSVLWINGWEKRVWVGHLHLWCIFGCWFLRGNGCKFTVTRKQNEMPSCLSPQLLTIWCWLRKPLSWWIMDLEKMWRFTAILCTLHIRNPVSKRCAVLPQLLSEIRLDPSFFGLVSFPSHYASWVYFWVIAYQYFLVQGWSC